MSRSAAAAFLALGLVAASPAASWASGLEARIGAFFPRAESNLFTDDIELYNVTKGDFTGVYGGAEFSIDAGPHVELGLSVDGYGRSIDTSYRDFTRDNGSEIRQTLKLDMVPVGISVRVLPLDRFATVQPYLTVGGDVVFYHYDEFGDFIDFFSPNLDISGDSFHSDGTLLGGHVAAGIRIPLGHDFALTAEGRYLFTQKKRMDEDFFQNDIDLSGPSATIGVRLRF